MEESMDVKRFIPALCLLAVAGLAACSGSSTPQLIGSYPRYGMPTPFAPPLRVYNTNLEIEVADVDSAARHAARLAYDNGGYLVASQSWYQDGTLRAALTLSVPASQFDTLRRSLMAL